MSFNASGNRTILVAIHPIRCSPNRPWRDRLRAETQSPLSTAPLKPPNKFLLARGPSHSLAGRSRQLPTSRQPRPDTKRKPPQPSWFCSLCLFPFLTYLPGVPIMIELPDLKSQTRFNLDRWTEIAADP